MRCDPALRFSWSSTVWRARRLFVRSSGRRRLHHHDRPACRSHGRCGPPGQRGRPPLALCSAELPAPSSDTKFIRLDYPGGANEPAGCPARTNSWQLVDARLPRRGHRLHHPIGDQIMDGCPAACPAIPGQEGNLTPGELTLAQPACAGGSATDPRPAWAGTGQPRQPARSWTPGKYAGRTPRRWALFPVFCAPPQCSASTIAGQWHQRGLSRVQDGRRRGLRLPLQRTDATTRRLRRVLGAANHHLRGERHSGNENNYLV